MATNGGSGRRGRIESKKRKVFEGRACRFCDWREDVVVVIVVEALVLVVIIMVGALVVTVA